ncbi:MAG: glutamine--tRNA ligase, partial [Clostridium sp.]|nr:glutamine--tRNA ligase [Clostridium sp.]
QSEILEIENNPNDESAGTRQVEFSRELYIEREDFMEVPVKKYFRLFPGNEVRLKGAYFVKCTDVIKDEEGNVTEIHCTYDPETKSGSGFTGRKVKGTIHWVNAKTAIPAEFRLYEPLILDDVEENEGKHFLEQINPNSLTILKGFIEPSVKGAKAQEKYQLFRHGYFNVDSKDSTTDNLVFNRIVSLKSSFKLNK